MVTRNFSVTLNASGVLSDGKSERFANFALSVRPSSAKSGVVTTYTVSCVSTAETLLSISFVDDGLRALPMPASFAAEMPGEFLDTYQSILPKLVAFVQAMGSGRPN